MKKYHINHTLRTIMSSYAIVLLLPLLFGIIFYLFALGIIRTEVDNAHMQLIRHVGDTIGDNIENMNNVMDAILVDSSVNALAKRTQYGKADYLKMREVQNELNLSVTANSYIDDILLYFHQADAVLGTQFYFSRIGAMKGRLDILSMDVAAFQQQLEQQNSLRFFIAPVSALKIPFVIRSNASQALDGEPTVTIFIRLRRDTLNKLMQAESSETFLFDKGNAYLCTGQAESIAPAGEILKAADTRKDYGGYRLLDCPALLSMRFIRLIPQSAYSRNIFYMKLLLLLYVAICLAIGIPLAGSMVRRSYHPIQQIVSILPNVSSQQDADDFRLIEQSLTELVRRNIHNEEIIDRRANAMKNYLMYKLIQEGEGARQQFLEEAGSFGICFTHEGFLLAGIDIEDGSSLFFENLEQVNQEMSHLAFFAVRNLLEDRMKDYPFFLAEYEGILLALINIDERFEKEHVLREIRVCSSDLFERMAQDFRVEISISLSDIHRGLGGIPLCYREMQEVVEYRSNCKTEPVLQFQDLEIDAEAAALEKAAISEIRGHSYRKAQELLAEATRFSEKREEGPPQEEAVPDDSKSLPAILAYIDTHYMDTELTVSAIAQQFNMTPSYLSLYFKRKTQLSPLEYIHKKRIEQVKLLLKTDMPVKAIARQTGYFDTRPMIRFFKRLEGITPTEYRERLHSAKQQPI